jgi:hypothetical protein
MISIIVFNFGYTETGGRRFCWLLNVHGFDRFRQTGIHTCEPLLISTDHLVTIRKSICMSPLEINSLWCSPVNLFVIGGQHGRGDVTIAYCSHLYADIQSLNKKNNPQRRQHER